MEDESFVTRSIIDEHLSRDIQKDQMEGESGFTRSIIYGLPSYIQPNQIEGESGVTGCIIDEVHSWNIQGDQK